MTSKWFILQSVIHFTPPSWNQHHAEFCTCVCSAASTRYLHPFSRLHRTTSGPVFLDGHDFASRKNTGKWWVGRTLCRLQSIPIRKASVTTQVTNWNPGLQC